MCQFISTDCGHTHLVSEVASNNNNKAQPGCVSFLRDQFRSVVDMPVHGEHAGGARVRRERRLRSFSWRSRWSSLRCKTSRTARWGTEHSHQGVGAREELYGDDSGPPLEVSMGAHSSPMFPMTLMQDGATRRLMANPNVWSDGSLVAGDVVPGLDRRFLVCTLMCLELPVVVASGGILTSYNLLMGLA